jgi:MarR family transcriptional regulator, organic hydroperoxide resistance regulator
MSTPIPDSIGHLLVQVCRAHRNAAQELLSALELYPGQEFLLLQLWTEEGVTQSDLVEHLCVQPATVTKTIDRLERAGLVKRRVDLADQRVSRIHLTDAGRALREPVEQTWQQLETRTLANFNAEERLLLRRLLLQIWYSASTKAVVTLCCRHLRLFFGPIT